MPKRQKQSGPPPVPLYGTMPTQADHVDPRTGKTEPDRESIEALRAWGEQSKL